MSNGVNGNRSEHVEQREFVEWFRQTFEGIRVFAIPNGEKRSKSVALRLKAEGVSPGVPDLFIPAWKLWIEMKREDGGTASAVQKEWIKYLESCGYRAEIAHGKDEAINICKDHFTRMMNADIE